MKSKKDVPEAVVDRIVAEVGGGKGAARVARELNAHKVPAANGERWSRSAVETIFKRATGVRTLTEMRAEHDLLAKRTTVKLPDELNARLHLEAKRRGLSVSELTREAIEAHLGGGEPRRFLSAASGRSGRHDIAERMEELLEQEWRP